MKRGQKRLTIPMRTALAAVQVAVSTGDQTVVDRARISVMVDHALDVLDWDRLEEAGSSMEYRPYVHDEAIPGYALCDGTGRHLMTLANHLLTTRILGFGRSVEAFMALPRGLTSLSDVLLPSLDDSIHLAEQLAP